MTMHARPSGGNRMTGTSVHLIKRLELSFAPRPWPFAAERRREIDSYFAALARENAALFNGSVLVMHQHAIENGVLRGQYLQTDYASFLAWRDWGAPDPSVRNCFALGAMRGSDGVFLLGVMADHTSNPGRIYFPGGTPDPSDIVDGSRVDLDRSMRRELREETGLDADEFAVEPGWTLIDEGPRLALIKTLYAAEPGVALRRRVLRHLARESQPELADIRLVRPGDELSPMVPPFAAHFLFDVWQRDGRQGAGGLPLTQRGTTC